MVLSSEIVGEIIVGVILWFFGLISGIITTFSAIFYKEGKTKKIAYKTLLPEIEANQERLQRWVNVIRIVGKDKVGHTQLPTNTAFDRTIYSSLADKIGLLDDESREKLVPYYGFFGSMEAQLRIIHEIFPATIAGLSNEQIPLLKVGATKAFFEFAEEAYNIGEELIKSLKEQIEDTSKRKKR